MTRNPIYGRYRNGSLGRLMATLDKDMRGTSHREAQVLRMLVGVEPRYLGNPLSQRAIARELGMGRQTVRKYREMALARIDENLEYDASSC